MATITALSTIEHDGHEYLAGETIELTGDQAAEQAAALIEAGVARKGKGVIEGEVVKTPSAEKPPTKKELLEGAAAEGLTLEVTDKNTVAEITAAIEAARESSVETPPAE